jgi:photosystem II stability/assembly factor-like uncharacterized protein
MNILSYSAKYHNIFMTKERFRAFLFSWCIGILMLCFFLASPAELSPQEESLFTETTINVLKWRSLGPAFFGGRVTDIAVPKAEQHTVYCAAATGGIWKTVNNGITWEPIFDAHGTGSMGAITVDDTNPNLVWAGTGEVIAGSHSAWGDGVYKSTDAGKSWTNMGLKESHYIGKIVIDPEDSDVVYVAAVGHLWGKNPERGLYKTTDGGKTWKKSLYISEEVGIVDIARDPSDNKTLYAAAYGRRRSRFSIGNTEIFGGGVYKTRDAGETWIRLKEGLPEERVGRIGLVVSPVNPNKLYAILERGPYEIRLPANDTNKIKALLRSEKQPEEKELLKIRELIDRLTPAREKGAAVVTGLSRSEQGRLRELLGEEELDTGGGVYRSTDRGMTWRRVNKAPAGSSFYSRIYAHPEEEDKIYVPTQRMWISTDGGETFMQAGWAFSSWLTSHYIHGDYHPFWIDPENPEHLIAGTDGGLYSSYDGGKNWEAHHMPIGQFYTVSVDLRNPYWIYGGLQDNGGWAGPSATRHMSGIADYDWFKYETADGGYVQIDPTDNTTVYSETQYGNIKRLDLRTGSWAAIQPQEEENSPPLRFHFVAPFLLSPHDTRTLYMGAQRLCKTTDKGETWNSISTDLTKGGDEATISTIAESPLLPGLLYAGTEDGNVQISQDGGITWANVAARIPGIPVDPEGRSDIYVSRVEASHHDAGTAYVSFDSHYTDDFGVYLYRTTDHGKNWQSIKGNLPDGFPIRVIKEDMKNPELLFVGTAVGVHVSIDAGKHWVPLRNGLPPVPVHDMVIHPRDADLVIGTHGRGIYVMDISPLQELTPETADRDVFLFKVQPATLFHLDITKNKGVRGDRPFFAPNPYSDLFDLGVSRYIQGQGSGFAPPGAAIYYYLKEESQEPVEITIFGDREKNVVRRLKGSSRKGISRVLWDLRESPIPLESIQGGNDAVRISGRGIAEKPGPMVSPGLYRVTLSVGRIHLKTSIHVKPDAHLPF